MDRPNTPGSRPPDYSLPSYDDELDTPTGNSGAAVRLLTSVDDFDSRPYVPPYSSLSSHDSRIPLPSSTQQPSSAGRKGVPARKAVPLKPPVQLRRSKQLGGGLKEEHKVQEALHLTLPAQVITSPETSGAASSTTAATPHQHSILLHNTQRSSLLARPGSVKLQKKVKPKQVVVSEILESLPAIPEGPSDHRAHRNNSFNSKPLHSSQAASQTPPISSTLPFSPSSRPSHGTAAANELSTSIAQSLNRSSHLNLSSPPRQARHSYQPSVNSVHSRPSSIMGDAPAMPPPDSTYVPFGGRDRPGSPQRPWTPSSRTSDYTRPPPSNVSYEPVDINGSPRPGTPSSRYGGSPRRPLPPAPLFSNSARGSQAFADDATIDIPLSGPNSSVNGARSRRTDDDDVFGPGSDLSDARPMPVDRDSYMSSSQVTLNHDPDDYDEEYYDEKTGHYGPAPDGAQERRGVRAPQTSTREVQLINGELILECKIPTILYSFLPRRDEVEFTHMRYTAVTCDPDDFVPKGYKLRQEIGRTARETELFICVTMYNEDEIGFTRTMHAVMKNIAHFCSRSKSRTWGEAGWQKIVVCIISDGREKIHPRTLDALAAMGVYQHGIAKNYVNNRAVQAHVYEYTTQVSLDSDLKFKGAEKGIVPCQLIFCLKEKNQRKLNSHRWFFNAFGRALNPNVCILLDVGTRPGTNSLYHLWKAFDTDSNVAGACGEIKAMKGKCLDPDTMVRTTQGPKAIRDLVLGDQLFDHQDNPVQCLSVEDIRTSPNMKKVVFTEWNSLNKTSFTCTPDHIMTLLAHSVKPCLHSNDLGVMWHTRCDRTELKEEEHELRWDLLMHSLYTEVQKIKGRRPTDEEARQYLKDITRKPIIPDSEDEAEDEDIQSSPALVKLMADLKDLGEDETDLSALRMLLKEHMNEYLEGLMPEHEEIPDGGDNDIIIDLDASRKRKIGSITLPSSTSDGTYRQTPEPPRSSPLQDNEENETASLTPVKRSKKSEPPSSSPIKESQASSYATAVVEEDHMEKFQSVREQLSKRHGNNRCKNLKCKGLRQVSLKFKTTEQARLAHELLSGDHYRIVDPCAVKDMELFTMTMEEYLNTCTPAMAQRNRKLRLYRAPLRFEPYQGAEPSIPIDPYWLGFWLGDGVKKNTGLTSSDLEVKVYVQSYVDRLNDDRPEDAAPLQLHEYLQAAAGTTSEWNGKTIKPTKDCFIFSITTSQNKPGSWNPIRRGLKDLGLLGDKSGGIPDCYMNANEDTRLAVLAGLIESDGWLQTRMTVYGFSQTTYEHKKIVEDAQKLAISCGIHCSNIEEVLKPGCREPSWRFYMRKGTEKFQHHLLLPRKRSDLTTFIRYNRDVRTFDVEDVGEGEYRTIEVSGGLYQLADRTVVHNCGINLLNPLVASQNFEYKMSNILDKPLESVFGYITVLPGALSAYRYHALQNDETGHGPLSQYFKGETLHGQHADVFTANMYLAEDRILCWELVAKRNERWVLKYVKGCKGETDVPDAVPEFISQRRRWLNGAFFAAVYSLVNCRQIMTTDHTLARKILLSIEFVYQFVQVLFTYFSLANFYLTFYFIAGGLADKRVDPFGNGIANVIFIILRFTCILLISAQFIMSLGNRPQGAHKLYFASMIIFAIIMMYTTFACVYIIISQLTANPDDDTVSIGDNVFTNLIVSTVSTYGLYLFMSLLYLEPWHMITSFIQYFLLLPSYICTLQVYAFCNTHDVTWGTKGDNVIKTDLGNAVGKGQTVELEMPSEQLDIDSGYDEALRNLRDRLEVPSSPPSEAQMQEDYYKSVRTYMVLVWMMANGILAMGVSEAYGSSGIGDNFYLRFILWSVAGLALFRAIGSTTFAVMTAVSFVVEGRVKMSLKAPKWMGGLGGKISDKVSSVGSSIRS